MFLKLLILFVSTLALAGVDTFSNLKVNYAYSEKGLFWETEFETNLSAEKIKALPETVLWNLWDKSKRRYVADVWYETKKRSLLKSHFKIEQPYVVYRILPHQSDLELEFALPGTQPKKLFSFPLGTYCNNPGTTAHFQSVDNNKKKCFEIKESDLPQDASP